MKTDDIQRRLTSWLAGQLPDAQHVRIEGLDRLEFGHSAETLLFTICWRAHAAERRQDVVLRLRPPAPGLLEPYNLRRQFEILRALESTPVRSPRALWFEGSGAVLGREFYVMERLAGTVYERSVPHELEADPQRIRRMSESMVEQIAAIHTLDLRATGLDAIADGRGYLDRELQHLAAEIRRVQRAPLPALERLVKALRDLQPEQCPKITLVHGDPKPGNFAFQGDQVSGVFDWEMATIGDPLADLGWAEITWRMPSSFTTRPASLSTDELAARYQELTGISVRHRQWYRAFQGLKIAVILLVGAMLFDAGFTDDLRMAEMGYGVHPFTRDALRDLGMDEELDSGPVTAREERVAAVRRRMSQV